MRRKRLVVFLSVLLILAMAVAAGCGQQAPAGGEQGGEQGGEPSGEPGGDAQVKIGLAISTLNNPFFVTLRDGAQAKADELGVALEVHDAQNDLAKQIAGVEDFVTKQVDVIIINPVDSDGIAPAVKAANDAGIPVISVDRGVNGAEVASHIASDNVAGGKMAGEYLIELIGGEGKVAELEGIPGASAARDRGAGFDQALEGAPGVEKVTKQPADFDRAKGLSVMENILQANPDIVGLFAHNDEMALGAIQAIEAAGKSDQITVVGFDAVDDALQAVKDGRMAGTVAQQPALMGSLGVESAVKLVNGEELPEYVPVDLKMVTPENVDEFLK